MVADPEQLPGAGGATATRWIDGLIAEGATILATYQHPRFGRWPAITTNAAGRGRITYVGTVPDQRLASALLRWADAGRVRAWSGLPASVTCTGGTVADGRRVRFRHNWSFDAARVTAPVDCRDVLNNKAVPGGSEIELGSWDVRVLVEDAVGA